MSVTPAATAARSFGRSRSVPTADEATPRKGGWGAADKIAASVGSNANLFLKPDEQYQVIGFLNADPFDWHSSHWLEWITEGSKSVICWDSLRDDSGQYTMPELCPLCVAGDDAKKLSVFFNVILLAKDEEPAFKVWETNLTVYNMIKAFATEAKTSPLNKAGLYFEVSKTGDAKKPTWKIVPVKGRDLMEDYALAEPSAEILAAITESQKTTPVKDPLPLDKMRELADKLP